MSEQPAGERQPLSLDERLKLLQAVFRLAYRRAQGRPVNCTPYWRRHAYGDLAAALERCRFNTSHSTGHPEQLADALLDLSAQAAVNYVGLILSGHVELKQPGGS